MIKDFIARIKDTKKIARERNVHNWTNIILHSILVIMGASLLLSFYTMFAFTDIGNSKLGEIAFTLLPIAYGVFLTFTLLDKIIILQIMAFEKLNKLIFKHWQKMDMYWFRKYKTHSPLTEGVSKISNVSEKLNKKPRTRKIIIITLIILLLAINLAIKAPLITDIINNLSGEKEESTDIATDIIPEEQEEQNQIIVKGAG